MMTVLRIVLVAIALGSLVFSGSGCGASDPTADETGGEIAATGHAPAAEGDPGGATGEGSAPDPGAASAAEAFKAMAASEGIYFGEVPEGFPLDIIPVHPQGEIDKSSIDGDGFTLLQMVGADDNAVLAHYTEHFDDLGWSANDPFTMGNRTMVSFQGPDARVDTTLIDQGDGKTFVALALTR